MLYCFVWMDGNHKHSNTKENIWYLNTLVGGWYHCQGTCHSFIHTSVCQVNVADSITPTDRMIVKVMIGRGGLQFNMGSEPCWRPGVPHTTKFMPCQRSGKGLAQGKILTGSGQDQTHDPQHRRPVPYPYTNRPHYRHLEKILQPTTHSFE